MSNNKTSTKDDFVTIEQEDLPDIVNFDETTSVTGRLLSFKTIIVDRKKVKAAILEADGKKFGVWISAGLADLNNMKERTVVRITSLGLEKVKKGKGHWRRFDIAYDPSTGGPKIINED
jgi:hypothetical protein